MKAARNILLFVVLVNCAITTVYGQLHPGPRATCPICNARLVNDLLSARSIPFGSLTEIDKLKLIKMAAPAAESREVLKVMDNMTSLSINHIHIKRDNSFKTYTVQFGDGAKSKFFSIRDPATNWQYSSNNINDIFYKLSQKDGKSITQYILFDDIYSRDSQNFMANIDLQKSKSKNKNINAIPSELYLKEDITHRWGSALFEPGAQVISISGVTSKVVNGIKKYTAKINLKVNNKNVAVIIYGKTKQAVKNFLNTLIGFFSASPETSIAIAVNRSRLVKGSNVDVVYQEASVAQFVENRSWNMFDRLILCELYISKRRRVSINS